MGGTRAMVLQRLKEMEKLWNRWKSSFASKKAPLGQRIRRLYQNVVVLVLWGSGLCVSSLCAHDTAESITAPWLRFRLMS